MQGITYTIVHCNTSVGICGMQSDAAIVATPVRGSPDELKDLVESLNRRQVPFQEFSELIMNGVTALDG